MFAWFQRLLPKTGGFFELFEAHARRRSSPRPTRPAACSRAGASMHDHIREIYEREHDADEIIREVLKTVRQTFLTPFDRSAITALIGAMDNAIDEMQAAASAIDLYEVKRLRAGDARHGGDHRRCRAPGRRGDAAAARRRPPTAAASTN